MAAAATQQRGVVAGAAAAAVAVAVVAQLLALDVEVAIGKLAV